MSNAPRPATWKTRSRTWAGQRPVVGAAEVLVALLLLGQGGAAGGAVGRHHPRRESLGAQRQHRAEDLGDHVAGLAQDDRVAGADVLALDLVGVVQRRPLSTVEPATRVGSITPNGVTRPVRPTLTSMSRSLVLTSSGGYLNAIAQRGARRGRAEPALQRDVVDLDDDAVDLVLDVVPVLAVVGDELPHLGERRQHLDLVAGGQAPGGQRVVGRGWVAGSKPSRAPMPWQTMPRSRVAVTRGSFCRSEPAAALRGLANIGLPASTIEALSRSKASTGRNTSPRTSTSAGTGTSSVPGSRWGTESMVLTLGVTSSPVRPSPRVSARTRRPLLVEQVDRQPVDLQLAEQRGVGRAPRGPAGRARRRAPRRRTRCRATPSAAGGRPR